MRKFTNVITGILMAFIILLPSCKCGGDNQNYIPRTGTVKVKPHSDSERTGMYCQYKVTGAPSEGAPALKAGHIICIFCPDGKTACDNFSKVEMEDGAVYPVSALTNGLPCTTCPAGIANPPGYTFEER